MKSLWLMGKNGLEYRLGWWDDIDKAWKLNDIFAVDLLALLDGLKWGNPKEGDIPDIEIITKDTNIPSRTWREKESLL